LKGARAANVGEAALILEATGMKVVLRPTEAPLHAAGLAREAISEGAGLVIAAGGDGTINEVANGLVGSDVPLAILPAGTASVLAMEMRIGKNIIAAAHMIPNMVPRRIALGRFTPASGDARHFILMAGAGMDASIAASVNPGLKRRLGKLAYWLAGFSATGKTLPQMEVEIGGARYRTGFALSARARNYGGDLELARNVTLLEDTFEVLLFEGKSTWPFAKYLAGAALGRMEGMKGVTIARGRELKLKPLGSEPVLVHIDGEIAGNLPATIEIVPDALTLMTPANLEARYRT
jgi:diacylglycerol kinase (ATP)